MFTPEEYEEYKRRVLPMVRDSIVLSLNN